MRLSVPKWDIRSHSGLTEGVTDEDSGRCVGSISHSHHPKGRLISLFDGKYVGSFERYDECVAFAKGVEAVLNHMISGGPRT
jgi:hypothetical protein